MIVADSGGIYGLHDRKDASHPRIRKALEKTRDQLVIPSVVLAEIDYLLRLRIGPHATQQFLSDIAKGSYLIEPVSLGDLERCREILSKYSDLNLGLCDASVIAVAERLGVDSILTVDERHFRVIRPKGGKPFRILPADHSR